MSISSRSRSMARGLFVSLMLGGFSHQAMSLSCSARSDNCLPLQGKLSAADEGTVTGTSLIFGFSASANAQTGALSASSLLSDLGPSGNGGPGARIEQVGATLFEQFTVQGPATSQPITLTGIFSLHGSILTNCSSFLQCEARVSYSANTTGNGAISGNAFTATFGASRSTGSPDLFTTMNFLGADITGSAVVDPNNSDQAFGMFSVGVKPGDTFTLDVSLSATASFGNTAPEGATAAADAGHTALLNFLLPTGYSVVATPGFLSTPILQAIPLPAGSWLFASALAFGLRARKSIVLKPPESRSPRPGTRGHRSI